MQVITFIRGGMPVPPTPIRPNLELRVVDFDSSSLDDLLLVAKYRIVSFPMSVVVDGRGNVLLRVRGTVLTQYLDDLLRSS